MVNERVLLDSQIENLMVENSPEIEYPVLISRIINPLYHETKNAKIRDILENEHPIGFYKIVFSILFVHDETNPQEFCKNFC